MRLPLNAAPGQVGKLAALQRTFAQACNALAPVAQQTRCWNRVGLHHLAYRQLREKFPELGSQMVCNAIYSVSRACRLVYQHPGSPFSVSRVGPRTLPLIHFLPQSPVYFDRHTLSIKAGQASMFTLDGRMRFQLGLSADDEQRFRTQKLREIVLGSEKGQFALTFHFAEGDARDAAANEPGEAAATASPAPATDPPRAELPEYMLVIEDEPRSPPPAARLPAPQQL